MAVTALHRCEPKCGVFAWIGLRDQGVGVLSRIKHRAVAWISPHLNYRQGEVPLAPGFVLPVSLTTFMGEAFCYRNP